MAHLTGAGGSPDVTLLCDAIRKLGDVEVVAYSPGSLLRSRWDVVHFHWPEWCINRDHGSLVTGLDAVRMLAQLQLAKASGAKIVWSGNNIWPHESDRLGVVDAFVSAFSQMVDGLVCPSQTAVDQFQHQHPALRAVKHRAIPLGHYRGIYRDDRLTREQAREKLRMPRDARIVTCLGLVRAYKNHLPLLRCYREIARERDDTLLVIAGKPIESSLADTMRRECRDIGNVRLDMDYVPDDDIQYYMRATDCVIAPTSLAVYSGAAMLALSYDRPVMLPHRGTFIEMRETLGAEWVHTYEGGLRASVLRCAFDVEQPSGSPPLEQHHDWAVTGRMMLEVYRELIDRAGRG
jgi:beta-1,4-mannosyltransferase